MFEILNAFWDQVRELHSSNQALQIELIFFCWLFSSRAVRKITVELRKVADAISGHTTSIALHGERLERHEKRIGDLEIDVKQLKPNLKGA